jgi:hypothetical protein
LNQGSTAPALRVSQWFNSSRAITLDELRGKVVLVHAFQMLCPACVMQAGPQAVRLWQRYQQGRPDSDMAVIGLHTVFEHHEVMTPHSQRSICRTASPFFDQSARLRWRIRPP